MSHRSTILVLVPLLTAGCTPRGEESRNWNVLLISIDTLRADHLSCYGAKKVRTPAMDRLASEGVLFEDAATVAPTTLPSHASLLTATTPLRHGVHDNVGFHLSPGTGTLASQLKAHGYETAAFVGAFVLDARFGLDRGFELYDDELGEAAGEMAGGVVAQRTGASVLQSALRWLSKRGESPYFAFVHFYDPHTPYEPPPRFSDGIDDESRYRGEVAYVDSLVSQLLEWLDTSGHREKTIVVLTSDHGESLGEHGELTHGYFVYQSTLRIPLIFRYPGSAGGSRVHALARIVDVAPTVLDLLGLPPLSDAEGESLLPLVRGEALERSSYSETYVPRLHYGWSELRSLRQGDSKLILAPRPELYDLSSDPDETRNLIETEPSRARTLRGELERLLERQTDAVEGTPLDEVSRRKLEALGYAGGGSRPTGSLRPDPKDRIEVYLSVNDPAFESIDASDGPAFAEAVGRLRRLMEHDPTIPRVYVLLGDLLLEGDRIEEAVDVFEKLVEIEPTGFPGHYGLGVALGRRGEPDAAVDSLKRALALEPRNTKAHFQLAEIEAGRQNWDAAEDWLRAALSMHADDVLEGRLVQVLVAAGKRDEALELLARMTGSDAHYELGQLLLLEGDPEGAIGAFQRALSTNPEDPELHQALGSALAGSGQLEEAVRSYREAIRLSPCLAKAHSNLGSVFAQLGRPREAARSFETAVGCEPGYAVAYKNLAAVRLEMGEVPAAVLAMRKAVEASPGDEELERMLRELVAYEERSR